MNELNTPSNGPLTGPAKIAVATIPVVALATIAAVGISQRATQTTEAVPVVATAPALAGSRGPSQAASPSQAAKPSQAANPTQVASSPAAVRKPASRKPVATAPAVAPKHSLKALPKPVASPSQAAQPSTKQPSRSQSRPAQPSSAPQVKRTSSAPRTSTQTSAAPKPSAPKTSAPKTTAPTAAPQPTSNGYGAVEQAIFTCINGHRTKGGLKPLVIDSAVNRVAENWSAQQAKEGRMYHNPNFSSQITGWSRVAENVGYYSGDGVAAVLCQAWMDSPGHRANIMNPAYTSTGIGVVKDSKGGSYATQNFKG